MKGRPCSTPDCRNEARADGARCNTCNSHRNPLRNAYQHLKGNAKRRGKPFDLTLDEFAEFAQRTEYLTKRGRARHSYHVDRIDPARGYTISNIQALTNRENVLKQRVEGDYNPETRQMEFCTIYTGYSQPDSGDSEEPPF